MHKTLLMFTKEIRVMVRDRRLMTSVVVSSLVALPAMMGFLTNIDKFTGGDEQQTHLLLETPAPELDTFLANTPSWVVHRDAASAAAAARSYLVVERQGDTLRILADGGRRRLTRAAQHLRDVLEEERQRRFDVALADRGIKRQELEAFTVEVVDTASNSRTRRLASTLMPYLVVLLLVTNANRAMYVAVGEKERKTLSSLLVSTAPRHAIVIGKSMAIVVFAIFSSILLILGLVLFSRLGLAVNPALTGAGIGLSATQVLEIAPNIMSLALFIASVIMVIGTFARSQREAGIYSAPLIFLAVFLAVFSMASSDFSLATYAVPILGSSLAMRETLLDGVSSTNLLLAIGGNLLVFAALVWVSVRLYHREEVLFRP